MRLLLVFLCLFSATHAFDSFFGFTLSDYIAWFDSTAEDVCLGINANRVSGASTRGFFGDVYSGFWDGFFDCKFRTSNTDNSAPEAGTVYGTSSEFGFQAVSNLLWLVSKYYGLT
uniref:Secreted protein n=1 Tax=Caenorhabditis tropicalis TaxID=1561998 RepID=A0A1I7UTC2_9PELO